MFWYLYRYRININLIILYSFIKKQKNDIFFYNCLHNNTICNELTIDVVLSSILNWVVSFVGSTVYITILNIIKK